jgi:dCTP deaminase
MILSEKTIRHLLSTGKLVIEPLDEKQIQPASIDLRIADEILMLGGKEIDFGKAQAYKKIRAREIVLPPRTGVLIRTVEHIELPNDVAGTTRLRSSLSRIGIFMNNAGWVDPGFKGTLTLSVFNANACSVKIRPGTRFLQLVLMKLDTESGGYEGKYLGQRAITGRRKDR